MMSGINIYLICQKTEWHQRQSLYKGASQDTKHNKIQNINSTVTVTQTNYNF